MVKVLFVCLGNICRSPMAEAIFRSKVNEAGLSDKIEIDSAGTGDWHIGRKPHEGTLNILKEKNIDASHLVARQIGKYDLQNFDYIIAMDAENVGNINKLKEQNESGEIRRLLDYVPEASITDVPDPYFTGNFHEVYDLIETGCMKLLTYIRKQEKI